MTNDGGHIQRRGSRSESASRRHWAYFAFLVAIMAVSAMALAQSGRDTDISARVEDVLRSVQRAKGNSAGSHGPSEPQPYCRKTPQGYLRALAAPEASYFPVGSVVPGNPLATARNFLAENRMVFGTEGSGFELRPKRLRERVGRSQARFDQTYLGVPIFGAETIVQVSEDGGVIYVLSDVVTDLEPFDADIASATPFVTASEAEQIAISTMSAEYPQLAFQATAATLMIYQPSVVGNEGPTQLIWYTEVFSSPDTWGREALLVDAHTGEIALQYVLRRQALDRKIYAVECSLELDPSTVVRVEGQAPCGIDAANLAYDCAEDAYGFYYEYHDRDGMDDKGVPIRIYVGLCSERMLNSYWDAIQLCIAVCGDAVTDDIIGHEYTHGVTQFESALLYINESGAINESFSDMWGEWIDLTNGKGNDSSAVRWWIGEDVLPAGYTFVGGRRGFRNMRQPNESLTPQPDCYKGEYWFDWLIAPLSDPNYDNGGVHTNSGVNNKLCYLLTDGDTFRGYQINGMGLRAVADLYYEAQTGLLTRAADYRDLFFALMQAANNLNWSSNQKRNLERACTAVGIWQSGRTYRAPNMPQGINSHRTQRSTLQINDYGTIEDLDAKVDIGHYYLADLDVYLIAPDGTTVQLFTDIGGDQNFMAGTILDDDAPVSILQGIEPYNGAYRPEGQLRALKGKEIHGTWTLEIRDDYPTYYGQSGLLNSWSLYIDVAGDN